MKIDAKLRKLLDAIYSGKTVYLWRNDTVVTMSNGRDDDALIAIMPRHNDGSLEYCFAQYDEGDWNTIDLERVHLSEAECRAYGRDQVVAALRKKRDVIDAEINMLTALPSADVVQKPPRTRSRAKYTKQKGKAFRFVGVRRFGAA